MAINNFSDNEDDFMSEINITPMVDVMLVLMLIFLVTAPVLTNSINVDLPKTNNSPAQDSKLPKMKKIFINNKGDIYFDENLQKNYKTLFSNVLKEYHDNIEIRIFADRNTPYHIIAKILGFLQKENITNIGLITEIE